MRANVGNSQCTSSGAKKILVIAPHVRFPIRNGADKYIVCKWGALDREEYDVTYIFADGLYVNGTSGEIEVADARINSRFESMLSALAPLRFLIGSKDYLYYRYNNPRIAGLIKSMLRRDWGLVVFSFQSTMRIAEEVADIWSASGNIVELHNCDPKIYLDRARESSWLRKYLYLKAAYQAYDGYARADRRVTYCALGSSDADIVRNMTNARVACVEIGYSARTDRSVFCPADEPVISFVGSLGVQMNSHAITQFVRNEWPTLREIVAGIKLRVIGSNPADETVNELLASPGVEVYANVTDEHLSSLISGSIATIVPFREANGMKLKVGVSIEHGVPYITFNEKISSREHAGFSHVGEDIRTWAPFIENLRDEATQRLVSRLAQSYCRSNSWSERAKRTVELVD